MNGHSPSELSNSVQEYAVPCHAKDDYENEILQWQQNGWLLPYTEEELGLPKGLIPLMQSVPEQKVCPVLGKSDSEDSERLIYLNSNLLDSDSNAIASQLMKCLLKLEPQMRIRMRVKPV